MSATNQRAALVPSFLYVRSCKIAARALFILLLLVNQSLVHAAQSKQKSASPSVIDDLVLVPGGEFIMGDNKIETNNVVGEFGNVKPWYMDEHPEHKMKLHAFYIEDHEVTNLQYLDFVSHVDVAPPDNWMSSGYVLRLKMDQLKSLPIEKLQQLAANVFRIDKDTRKMSKQALLKDIKDKLKSMDNLPVTYVSWKQASDFCHRSGLRLPTEAEWEKAARGANGQEFPWGNEFKKNMSNTGEEKWAMGVAPVKSYPKDKSPYGVYDLAGNVSEWTADWYKPYPHSDYKSDAFGEVFKVARGAGWSGGAGHYALKLFQRGAYRSNLDPKAKFDDVGFRCAGDDTPQLHAKLTHVTPDTARKF